MAIIIRGLFGCSVIFTYRFKRLSVFVEMIITTVNTCPFVQFTLHIGTITYNRQLYFNVKCVVSQMLYYSKVWLRCARYPMLIDMFDDLLINNTHVQCVIYLVKF